MAKQVCARNVSQGEIIILRFLFATTCLIGHFAANVSLTTQCHAPFIDGSSFKKSVSWKVTTGHIFHEGQGCFSRNGLPLEQCVQILHFYVFHHMPETDPYPEKARRNSSVPPGAAGQGTEYIRVTRDPAYIGGTPIHHASLYWKTFLKCNQMKVSASCGMHYPFVCRWIPRYTE